MASHATEKILIDHDDITRWAEERGAVPARVKGTEGPQGIGVLRLHFPEYSERDDKLEEISWDEFLEEFDRKGLALLVEEKTADGSPSNFNKIISRATVADFHGRHGNGGGKQAQRSSSGRSRTGSTSSRGKSGSTTSRKRTGSTASRSRTGSASSSSSAKRTSSGKKQATSARSQKKSAKRTSSASRRRAA
jgi:anaerobic selenocysteine-containing dehydrogenase